jgi:hypothetical protein
VTSPPVYRRGGETSPRTRPIGHGRTRPRRARTRRARRRSPWSRSPGHTTWDLLAGLVLIIAAIAWLVTFSYVLNFVW